MAEAMPITICPLVTFKTKDSAQLNKMAEVMTINLPVVTWQNGAGNYHYFVRLPPKSIWDLLCQSGGEMGLESQFETGILSGVRHLWQVKFYEKSKIRIRMDLRERDDNNNRVTLLQPVYLQLFSGRNATSTHEMRFQPVGSRDLLSSEVRWQATWVNDGSWNSTIDTMHIAFDVS